jgi:ferredoxin--NADP+ reductase
VLRTATIPAAGGIGRVIYARSEPAKEEASMGNVYLERVIEVNHWTDRLFSFSTTRSTTFRFESGQFTMIGLPASGCKPTMRAYSMTCAIYDEQLEFLSIKIHDGKLTSHLQKIRPGDEILVGMKPTGTLLLDNLLPGKRLYLLGTGTGLAPFLSIIKDPRTYERFERVVLVHGVRKTAELVYRRFLADGLRTNPCVGEHAREQLIYCPTVTREPFPVQGRITSLIDSGKLFTQIAQPDLNPKVDRAMICGGVAMIADVRRRLVDRRFAEGTADCPGHFVFERAFVD